MPARGCGPSRWPATWPGLGLIRVIGEQADPAATAAWTPDGLVIDHDRGRPAPAWLADEYVPTPVLSPWNSGSGFGAKDKEPLRALEALLAHPSPRLAAAAGRDPRCPAGGGQGRGRGWITDGGDERRQGPRRSGVP